MDPSGSNGCYFLIWSIKTSTFFFPSGELERESTAVHFDPSEHDLPQDRPSQTRESIGVTEKVLLKLIWAHADTRLKILTPQVCCEDLKICIC